MNLLQTVAQYSTYDDYSSQMYSDMPNSQVDPTAALLINLLMLVVVVFYIVVMWRIFSKASQAGWKSIIPFYNIYVLTKHIVGAPTWFAVLSIFLSPLVIITHFFLARSFGKGNGFAVCNVLFGFITLPILAFSGARYVGPSFNHEGPVEPTNPAAPTAPTQTPPPTTPSATPPTTPTAPTPS